MIPVPRIFPADFPIATVILRLPGDATMTLKIPTDSRDAVLAKLAAIHEELGAMVSQALDILDAHKAA